MRKSGWARGVLGLAAVVAGDASQAAGTVGVVAPVHMSMVAAAASAGKGGPGKAGASRKAGGGGQAGGPEKGGEAKADDRKSGGKAADGKPEGGKGGPISPQEHTGALDLKWGKGPADARSVLAGKVEFVSEKPAAEDAYHTIDQHYRGAFGKLPTNDIFLRFYNGEFFYLVVTLQPVLAGTQPPVPIPLSSVWQVVVDKMTNAYGPAFKSALPPHLASDKAVAVALPPDQTAISPLLWNERTQKNQLALYQLRDLQIRTDFWDPFASWKFSNGVTIQTFLFRQAAPGTNAPTWTPVWLFVKDDLYHAWRATVHEAQIIEPRDF